jgi:hypothetical protein
MNAKDSGESGDPFRVQQIARRPGNDGARGNVGSMESATYRI